MLKLRARYTSRLWLFKCCKCRGCLVNVVPKVYNRCMIISMRPHASRAEIDHVCERIRDFGYRVHSIEGEERVVIGVVGMGDVTACLESLEATPGVESAVRISAPYKFVSREFKKERSAIRVNGIEVGGDEFIVMAGPCSVESERQIMETAEGVAAAGAKVLRGGAFKPRTSPYDFQGMEEEGSSCCERRVKRPVSQS